VFLADRIILFSARPARILRDINVTDLLSSERSLQTRETQDFFKLRNEVLHMVRTETGLHL
jgi:ABC-type nitrate/sulfonate/bicarbonate transport system ATPase subunit